MNRECVLNCDFFRDVSNECIIRLVHSFKFAVFLAHDVLADEGELASELVFVIHGSAKVMKRGKLMPVSLLSPGDYFGEKSLLMHHRNAVSVVAIENCDTRVLEKMDFEDLCIDFPELRDSILKRSNHMDVTEYDTHKRRRSSMRNSKLTGGNQLVNLDLSLSTSIDGSTKTEKSPKGGVFSFEPVMGGSMNGSGIEGSSSSKARINQVLQLVQLVNERLEKMDSRQRQVDAKLNQLLMSSSFSEQVEEL
jgi:CRP-like cAMP-binding protein